MSEQTRNRVNDVKGCSLPCRTPSSGRDQHATQVYPDRQPATAIKTGSIPLKIATWNVRTMLQKGKLDNIKREMERLNINILGISEVRWKGAGVISSGTHKLIYSGRIEHERGVGIIMDQET